MRPTKLPPETNKTQSFAKPQKQKPHGRPLSRVSATCRDPTATADYQLYNVQLLSSLRILGGVRKLGVGN